MATKVGFKTTIPQAQKANPQTCLKAIYCTYFPSNFSLLSCPKKQPPKINVSWPQNIGLYFLFHLALPWTSSWEWKSLGFYFQFTSSLFIVCLPLQLNKVLKKGNREKQTKNKLDHFAHTDIVKITRIVHINRNFSAMLRNKVSNSIGMYCERRPRTTWKRPT